MGKQIKIQHYYTTSNNAAPAANDLTYGEIAVSHSSGKEGLYILKNDGKEVVKIPAIAQEQIDRWNNAASGFSDFMTTTGVADVVDTLLDIQTVLGNEASGASNLVTTVKANTDKIASINGDIADISSKTENCFTEITGLGTTLRLNTFVSDISRTGNTIGVKYQTFPVADVSRPNGDSMKPAVQGICTIVDGDIKYVVDKLENPVTKAGEAASSNHYHSDYIKFTDLEEDNNRIGIITIHCGTW